MNSHILDISKMFKDFQQFKQKLEDDILTFNIVSSKYKVVLHQQA